MRKTATLFLIALLGANLGLSAQSLKDNSYYQRSLELKDEAAQAFNQGDYDAAAQYAAEAKENAELSDKYVEKMVAIAEADRAIATAKDRLAWADTVNAKVNFPSQYGTATTEFDAAQAAYGQEDYLGARDHARASVSALASVPEALPWPASYTVRLIPARRDCLWRIAEYPFIYNNPLKWPVIYAANKKTFRDPGNPNLIFPGQVLTIPSVAGEIRSGPYDPTKEYPPFPKK